MMQGKTVSVPFRNGEHRRLQAGEMVFLSGVVYCARDVAHRRFYETLREGRPLPLELRGATIFYAAPTPSRKEGEVGAIGPTTSYRMDVFTPALLERTGLTGMIGKGTRTEAVRRAIADNGAIYFGAIGGVAALTRKCVLSVKTVAYEDLTTEAVLKLEVRDLPLIVVIDSSGRQLGEGRHE